jgi:polysaccharide biosynthesis protein VpsQ
MSKKATRVWRLLALAFLLSLLAVAAAADLGRIPGCLRALYSFPGGDKLGHFGLYGAMGFLGAKAWPRPLLGERSALVLGLLPPTVLACLEEASQIWLARRSADWLDLGSGLLGIAVAALIVARIDRWALAKRRSS